MAEWLKETDGKTIFEGDVLRLQKRQSGRLSERVWDEYDITRGGWNFDPGPDTWLTAHVLARFNARRVRTPLGPLRRSPFSNECRRIARADQEYGRVLRITVLAGPV